MDAQMMQRTMATVAEAAMHSDTCLLFWSGTGKDSIVLLDLLSPHFKKVVCVYLYIVKNLNIVEPFFRWAYSYGNVEIVQLPHPDRIRCKKYGTFDVKKMPQLKELKLKDYEDYPIVCWSNKDCLSYISIHNLPKPLKLGSKRPSSGINFREETVLYIKKHYPLDYQKYITDYPLIGAKYGKD